jgi:o-succinylbenzoate---CoA ligase
MRPRTIVALDEWLTQAARRRPDHPALDAEGRTLTYGELGVAAARTARRLIALGVGGGDRVATALPPGVAFCELLHALPRLGAVLVPLDPRDPVRVDARITVTAPVAGAEADVPLRDTVDPDAVHSVVHTSGTTGRPKAVELTYGNHAASALASADALGVHPCDRWLCPLPVFHVGGLGVLIRSVINATTARVHDRFDTGAVKDVLEGGEVSLASLVPTMLVRLRAAGLRRAPGMRAIALGGGPIPAGLLDWARGAALPVVPVYGMTETCSQVTAGSPGRPLRGVELEIAADGEILVRGPMVARGSLGPDGWLHTGDLGHLDQDGGLHVDGRVKELIVTGGENVAPIEVEQALLSHPAVADAGVAGRPDPEWGEAVTAFVVLRRPATADELRAWCRERLAPHKTPKTVHEVAALPRNAGGKLLRDRLGDTGLRGGR